MSEGLVHKYLISHSTGEPVDPSGQYFVLKLNSRNKDHANASRMAVLEYASYIGHSNQTLGEDLKEWVARLDVEDEADDT